MFEFRFLDDKIVPDETTESAKNSNEQWFEAKEIQPNLNCVNEILDKGCIDLFKYGNNCSIKHLTGNITNLLGDTETESPVFNAERSDSDLLTGVYEGGLKIWECTYDLANYIDEAKIDFKTKTVLDLGCGAGVIGLLAFVSGSSVYFQDYNEEIINYVTIPNVYLNSDDNNLLNTCKFYAGDWNSFLGLVENDLQTEESKFDYIFTCETIYNPSNYQKLHAVFKQQLKKNGVVYLAAKTHYFGVGGGLRQFEEFLTKENVFKFSTCWKCSEGLQREILEITFKKSS